MMWHVNIRPRYIFVILLVLGLFFLSFFFVEGKEKMNIRNGHFRPIKPPMSIRDKPNANNSCKSEQNKNSGNVQKILVK